VYANQARALLRQGRAMETYPWLDKAFKLAAAIGYKDSAGGLTEIYLLHAQADLRRGETERAWAFVQDALKLIRTSGNQRFLAMATATLARIHSARGDRDQAAAAYGEALALYGKIGDLPGLLRAQLHRARFLSRDDAEAAARLEKETRDRAAQIGLYLPA
jgi:tetratricopeptide (TPR) repeat protein